MSTIAKTTCDVPGCKEYYDLEYNKSYSDSHPMHKWLKIKGNDICPIHAIPLIEIIRTHGVKT